MFLGAAISQKRMTAELHWSRSLKGRAVAVQLLSAPIFIAGGVLAGRRAAATRPGSLSYAAWALLALSAALVLREPPFVGSSLQEA